MTMSVERCNGRYLILALSSLALGACSSSNSTAAPAANSAAPVVAAAAVTTAPLVTGLPDFTALVEHYGPAVVNIEVTEARQPRRGGGDPLLDHFREFGIIPDEQGGDRSPRGQQRPDPTGEGSGFIVTSDGYILTNRHVVADATKVVVRLTDRREYTAKVVGMDEATDVAVIKIEGGSNLPTVRLGNPELLKPGQWVVAIGSPFGMANSVTAGIVSATTRRVGNEKFVPFIQTDVAVNPGNSGGPLFNLNGEVVGINSQIYSPSGAYVGLSFAIPIDIANEVREQLVSTGKVTRGLLGVHFTGMNFESAKKFGLDRPRGALVTEVIAGESAEKAGIKPDDVILSVGGKPVEDEVSLPAMVARVRPGASTELELWSEGKLRKVTVKLGENKPNKPEAVKTALVPGGGRNGDNRSAPAAEVEPDLLGLSVRPMTREERQQANSSGVLIIERVSGAAQKSGLRPNDIILDVGAASVSSVAELKAAAGRVTSKNIPLRVQRGDAITFFTIPRE
jgi:serine protease Do